MATIDWHHVQYDDDEHFYRYVERNRSLLPIVSLILSALLIGGLTFFHEDVASALGIHRPVTMLEHAGGIQLSVTKLIDHTPLAMHAGHTRYWLGPLAGSTYTTNCVTPGILKVTYLGPNQTLNDGTQPTLIVTAYESQALYDTRLRPLSKELVTGITNAQGDKLSYDGATRTELTIKRNISRELITIQYSTPQSVNSMVYDSEKLATL